MGANTQPVCHVVAGPNGSGKSTFALVDLPEFAGSIEYVNPDLMAQGLLYPRNGARLTESSRGPDRVLMGIWETESQKRR